MKWYDQWRGKFEEFQNFREKGQQVVHIFDSVPELRLNSPVVILIGRWKQWSLDNLDKKDKRRPREQICLPVDNCMLAAVPPVLENFCYPACCSNVQCVHGVLAKHLSKSQKRAYLKENLSSKRDTASIESEFRWQDIYMHLYFDAMKELGH